MDTLTTVKPIGEIIRSGQRFAHAGQTLTIDLVRSALEVMPFASRGEEIIDVDDDDQPADIDLLRRRSVM